jgi:hypothetical protein
VEKKIEIQMQYFGITQANDKRMCLLVHGGDQIMSIDTNAGEPEVDEEIDQYQELITKIENVFIPKKSQLHSRFSIQ